MHTLIKITSFEIIRTHLLRITFDDGQIRLVDLGGLLNVPLYSALRDPAVFNQVTLDSEVGTLVWPNGADFDPETLYHWPEIGAQFVSQMNAPAQLTHATS
jgi:hypothetical protein